LPVWTSPTPAEPNKEPPVIDFSGFGDCPFHIRIESGAPWIKANSTSFSPATVASKFV